jgi:hypothetical protein
MRNTLYQPKSRVYHRKGSTWMTLVRYRTRRQFMAHSQVINRRKYMDECDLTAALYRLSEGAGYGEGYPLRGKTITLANCFRPVQLDLIQDGE